MLTREEVILGYRYLLGREPEDAAVVDRHAAAFQDFAAFRLAVLRSPEFGRAYAQFQTSRWVAAPVFDDTRLLWIDLRDRYVSLGCLMDAYEPAETEFLRRILHEGDTFLDIGANVGWFTMLASTLVGPGGAIHAFEPRSQIATYLQRSVTLNGLDDLVTVHPIGLSNESGAEALMWEGASDNGGMASFARGECSPDVVREDIAVRRLDDLGIAGVSVVKIDVEGAERLALDGAAAMLARDRPIVLSEVYPWQLSRVSRCTAQDYFDFFRGRGFSAYIVDAERLGEPVSGFPPDWRKEIVNVAFFPSERRPDSAVFAST